MQFTLCKLKFCDFVVWSPKGMSVERIFVNNDLWSYMCPQLEAFHRVLLSFKIYIEIRKIFITFISLLVSESLPNMQQ